MKKFLFDNAKVKNMSLEDVNKNIKIVGKQLAYRINRLQSAKPSRERNLALAYNAAMYKNIVTNVKLSGKVSAETAKFKEFTPDTINEGRATLLNLQSTLISNQSTISGQIETRRHRYAKFRETIAGYGIKRRFTNKQLDILTEVFANLEEAKYYYESDEVIEEFSEFNSKDISDMSVKEIAGIIDEALKEKRSVFIESDYNSNYEVIF